MRIKVNAIQAVHSVNEVPTVHTEHTVHTIRMVCTVHIIHEKHTMCKIHTSVISLSFSGPNKLTSGILIPTHGNLFPIIIVVVCTQQIQTQHAIHVVHRHCT